MERAVREVELFDLRAKLAKQTGGLVFVGRQIEVLELLADDPGGHRIDVEAPGERASVSRARFRGPALGRTVWCSSLVKWPVCARESAMEPSARPNRGAAEPFLQLQPWILAPKST